MIDHKNTNNIMESNLLREINRYILERHNQDECSGFIDGLDAVSSVVTQLFDDMLEFAEWINMNCIRQDKNMWLYKGDRYSHIYTIRELYEKFDLEIKSILKN